MANLSNQGRVSLGGNIVGNIVSNSMNTSANLVDMTIMTDTWTSILSDQLSWSSSVEVHFNDSDAAQTAAVAGASLAFVFEPLGSTTGSPRWTGTGTVESVDVSLATGSVVGRTLAVTGSGPLVASIIP